MPLVHENVVGVAASVIPWAYVASGAAAATALVLLSNKLYGCLTHKNGVPLPPGPPATWVWGNPMPKQKYVWGKRSPCG